jgi:hypothetical protein
MGGMDDHFNTVKYNIFVNPIWHLKSHMSFYIPSFNFLQKAKYSQIDSEKEAQKYRLELMMLP